MSIFVMLFWAGVLYVLLLCLTIALLYAYGERERAMERVNT